MTLVALNGPITTSLRGKMQTEMSKSGQSNYSFGSALSAYFHDEMFPTLFDICTLDVPWYTLMELFLFSLGSQLHLLVISLKLKSRVPLVLPMVGIPTLQLVARLWWKPFMVWLKLWNIRRSISWKLCAGVFLVLWVQCIDSLVKRSQQRRERFFKPLSFTAIFFCF